MVSFFFNTDVIVIIVRGQGSPHILRVVLHQGLEGSDLPAGDSSFLIVCAGPTSLDTSPTRCAAAVRTSASSSCSSRTYLSTSSSDLTSCPPMAVDRSTELVRHHIPHPPTLVLTQKKMTGSILVTLSAGLKIERDVSRSGHRQQPHTVLLVLTQALEHGEQLPLDRGVVHHHTQRAEVGAGSSVGPSVSRRCTV